jgi:hypothetical protein
VDGADGAIGLDVLGSSGVVTLIYELHHENRLVSLLASDKKSRAS